MSSQKSENVESNPAVFRCCESWRTAYKAARAKAEPENSARAAAANAFMNALPPLFGVRNTRNFIACVTYASILRIIDGPTCSRLLYAAQVAHSTRRHRPRKAKPRDDRAQKGPSQSIQTTDKAVQEPSSAVNCSHKSQNANDL